MKKRFTIGLVVLVIIIIRMLLYMGKGSITGFIPSSENTSKMQVETENSYNERSEGFIDVVHKKRKNDVTKE